MFRKPKLKEKVTITIISATELDNIKKLLEDNGYEVNTVPLSFDEGYLIKKKADGTL